MGPHATACYGATTIRQHDTSQANGSAEHDWNVQNRPGQTLVHDEMGRLADDGQRGRFGERRCGITVYSFREKIS